MTKEYIKSPMNYMGMSKTGACENAIRLYMDKMRKAVKTIK